MPADGPVTPPPTPETVEPERRSRVLFAWLWRNYMRRHWFLLVCALALMAIEGTTLGLMSLIVQPMFDRVFVGGDMSALWWVGFGVLGLFALRAATSVSHKVLLTRINQRTAAEIRSDLLRHIMALDTTFHQRTSPGYLIERVHGDVGAISAIWSGVITGVGRDAVSLVWLFGVAVTIDWRWTLAALIGVPLLVLPSLALQRMVRNSSRDAREIISRMTLRLDEVFHGINPIKLNGLERYQARRYESLTEEQIRAEMKSTFGQALIPGMLDLMSGIGFFGVMIYGGSEIIAGEKTVGEFMSFFTAMGLAFDPLRRLGGISGKWQSSAASIERLMELFSLRPTLVSPAQPRPAPREAPSLELRDVHLAYGDLPVLRGTSFVAEAGKTTALVGASGAGKSTVFNVLTRLVEPLSGEVLVGGVPSGDLALKDLRALFSVVSQDAALFDETLRENVLLDRAGLDDAVLSRVLEAAHVADFLPMLAEGLDSPAGPRGSNLSGGQRQRVAIARALLRDTPILLLDEATSALDSRAERIVQDALDQLSVGRTTLVIAHRLSTVQNADKIVVMDRGRVVEQGTHEALLARGGLYADLHSLQFKTEAAEAG